MRSAWSPTRSMSFDTVFDVWPTRLLALPAVLAIDFTSSAGRLGLLIERGTGTPRTFLRRGRLFSARAPATPAAAAAPTASAGPRALPAAVLTVPTTPFVLWLSAGLRCPPVLLEREEPLLEREALLRPRVDADVFERDDPPEERDEPLRDEPLAVREDPLAFVFEPEPFDELLLLCPLREADLLLAIPHPLVEGITYRFGLPALSADNRNLVLSQNADLKPLAIGYVHAMSETPTRDAKVVQLLNEAYAKEKQLEVALQAHVEITTRDDYSKRLNDHLKETHSHASQLAKRIKQLGGNAETVSVPGPEGLTKAAESVSDVVAKAKAAAQAPLQAVRGSGEQEKMLRNARTQYRNEADEIAIYTVIDSVATATGDKQTAKLARDIMRQEERMQQFLAKLLRELSVDFAHDEIPVSEIAGQASHRTAADSKRKSSSRRSKAKA